MVDGFAKGIKYAMLIANGIIFVGGIVVFSVGVWTLTDKSFMHRLLATNTYVASASILIATGLLVFIISFVGCFGAWKEIRCMLIAFFFILAMIFLTMLAGGLLGYIFRSEVDQRMHTEMIQTIRYYGNDTQITEAWDAVQEKLSCCGIILPNGSRNKPYSAWNKNARFSKSQSFPESCCKFGGDEKVKKCRPPQAEDVHQDDCYEKIKDFVKGHALIVGGIGIGIAVLLIFGMILSCALFLVIK